MNDSETKPGAERDYEQLLREMNEVLLVSSLRQHELTEQAQNAEHAAARLAEMSAKLVEQSPFGTYIVDAQFRIAHVSAGALPPFRNVRPLIGRDFAEAIRIIWPEPFASQVIAIFRHTLETGESYVSPGLIEQRRDTGTTESYEWQTHRLTLANGQYGVVCYFFDSTRLRQAEAALRASEHRYRTIVEQVKDYAIFSTDVQGRATTWNQGVKQCLGFDETEFLGQDVTKTIFTSEAIQDRVPEKELEQAAREGSASNDRWMRRKNGERFFALGVTTALKDENGRLLGFTKVMHDQTERKRMEETTRQQAAALSDLHHRKDEFLAMLSHELRNPLAPIVNAVQLLRLQRGSEGEIERQARTIIERQVGQLKHLVDDLLEVSRITTGRVQLRQKRVTVNGVVDRAVETARPLIQQRQHELTVSLPPKPVWLYADAARLEQVVVNLLTNAAKYTNDGGHIWLTVQQEGEAAVLRVRDTGVGIVPELLPRIFDLFTQAERSLDRSEGGLGIGLSLVQRLVELHGGEVSAQSPGLGQGAVFTVALPMSGNEAAAANGSEGSPALSTPSPAPASSPSPVLPLAGVRVLAVDDEADARQLLTAILSASGAEVRTAGSMNEALHLLDTWQADVLVSDIGMPNGDGYDLVRALRQRHRTTGEWLPAVALTAYARVEDRLRALAAGFQMYVTKPVEPQELLVVVASLTRTR